ncbi:MFS transporter [Actinomadura rupiterrae]|uniref:MFS transporter n=1 Tax=Actinomadura rupiterrae TaxID=559627 RepID=UPI0020A5CC50|nr:MFS transporter [Actinomadura rupiterrae]MCP2343202.1 EmrB/QacA subfamily drug resistance transporter [Actinomadura rupiterrae]
MRSGDASTSTGVGAARTGGVLFAMCLSLVLVVASVSALNLALPDLAVGLSASSSALTWIADGYTVALAALVLPLGAVGDRFGRRKVLLAGNVVFGAASLAAAFADSTSMLIVWRVVMGAGAAMIMPGTLSTITASFPVAQRSRGVAVWSGFAAAGAVLGMLAAGALLEAWSWRSIFVASAVVAVASVAAAAFLAPETKDPSPGRFDRTGTAATAVAVGGLVFAIIEGNENGWTEPPVLAAVAVTVLGLAAYVFFGLRAAEPLLDPRLFRKAGFRAGTLSVLVQFLALFGFFFIGLQYLQLILGYSPFKSAVALIPVGVVVLSVSKVAPLLVERAGVRWALAGGLMLLAGAMFWLAQLDASSGYLPFLAGLIPAGVGIGLTGASGTSAIVSSLGPEQQGVASAMNDTTREVGSAIGIAVMGSVFSSHYRDALPAAIGKLPPPAAEAVHRAPAAGLEAAARLGSAGPQTADWVKDAFMSGLSASLTVVSVILAVAALACVLVAPGRRAGGTGPYGPEHAEAEAEDSPVLAR